MNKRFFGFLAVLLVPLLVCFGVGKWANPQVYFETITPSDALIWNIEEIGLSKTKFTLNGYLLLKGDSQWFGRGCKRVWLVEQKSKSIFQIDSSDYIYGEVEESTEDMSYRYCGLRSYSNIEKVLDSGNIFNVFLVYQLHGNTYGVDTGYRIIDGQLVLS